MAAPSLAPTVTCPVLIGVNGMIPISHSHGESHARAAYRVPTKMV